MPSKSQALLYVGKPRWCPMFIWKPYALITGRVVVYAVSTLDASDLAPGIPHYVPTRETDNG